MTPHITRLALVAVLALTLSACGGDKTTDGGDSSGGAPAAATVLLAADMPDAVNVFSAKKMVEGDEVVVFGRVRAEVDGSAAFTIIDTAVEYNVGGHQVLGLLASARDKLILLSAAQDAAKNNATLELLQQILDEDN